MATGKTHQKVNLTVIVITIIVVTILFITGVSFDIHELTWFAFGIAFGFFFDPDLDLDGVTMAEARMANLLKYTLIWIAPRNREFREKVFGFYLYFVKVLLYPYALMIPHRSLWSHLPVIADIIRTFYIAIIASFGYYFVIIIYNNDPINDLWPYIWSTIEMIFFSLDYMNLKISFIFGSSIMTFSHLMMDKFKIRW